MRGKKRTIESEKRGNHDVEAVLKEIERMNEEVSMGSEM
jgi:hypothetical protein